LKRGAFSQVAVDLEFAMEQAWELSRAYTDRLGVRAIDLLHVACALSLKSEVFLTFDERPAVNMTSIRSLAKEVDGIKLTSW